MIMLSNLCFSPGHCLLCHMPRHIQCVIVFAAYFVSKKQETISVRSLHLSNLCYVPGTVLCTLDRLIHSILTAPYEVDIIILPILQMRKQRFREIKQPEFAQGHAVSK